MALKPNEIRTIDLFVTEECNLQCDYCFHNPSASTLTVEQGKKILDEWKKLSPNNFEISFFGGEPLLYPETVLALMDYSRNVLWKDSNGKVNVGFHITTNGTYFDEAMFKKYLALGASIQLSIDGDEKTQREHRGGDPQLIYDNALKIRALFPDDKLSCRMTFTPNTVGRLSVNVTFIRETLGITRIMFHATMEDTWSKEDLDKYNAQLNNLYHYRRYLKKSYSPIDIMFIDKPLKIVNDEQPGEKDFCQAGKTYLAILPNGDVYPCHRAASKRIFKLGNMFEKRPFIRGMFLEINKDRTGCSDCQAVQTCHSCPITHYVVNGDLMHPLRKSGYCGICEIEAQQAYTFLPTELSDKFERKIDRMGVVIADMAEQLLEKEKKNVSK